MLAIGLAGCATKIIDDKMKTYVGQPASAVIAALGLPTRQDEIAGHKVYVWEVTSMYRGTSRNCTIRAILGAGDIVSGYYWQGNEEGCENYAMVLGR